MPIEEVLATALTRGGLSVDDFECLTLTEWAAVAGAICRREESRERLEWERTRLLFYASLAPHIGGSQNPYELLPLPWDTADLEQQKKEAKPPTKEEIARMLSRFGED